MSDPKQHNEEKKGRQPETDDDDFDDAVMAADDTGMVRNEAQIVEVETDEHLGS